MGPNCVKSHSHQKLSFGQLHTHKEVFSTMSKASEVWVSERHGDYCEGAFGPRDVLIIRSSEMDPGNVLRKKDTMEEDPDIVPRKTGVLTDEDKDRLTSQGIPRECWGDDVRPGMGWIHRGSMSSP